jgi:hypothetical protein
MANDSVVVQCGQCRSTLAEDPHAVVEGREPCPHCDSVSRHFNVAISATATARSKLTAKGRRAGEKRPFIEQTVGDDLYRKTGRWMNFQRVIDRLKNWYHERVADPATGAVVHECDEPLTEHRGHGSAKQKRHPNAEG